MSSATKPEVEEDHIETNEEQGIDEEEEEQSVKGSAESSVKQGGIAPIPIKKKPGTKKRKADQPPQEEIDAALDLLLHGVPTEDFDPVTLKCCITELNKLIILFLLR